VDESGWLPKVMSVSREKWKRIVTTAKLLIPDFKKNVEVKKRNNN